MGSTPFGGPSGEMRSSLGRHIGESEKMDPAEEKAAREAIAGFLEKVRSLGPVKSKELVNEIVSMSRRLNEEKFVEALRAKAELYGFVLGDLPRRQREAAPEEIRMHEDGAPLTASMGERLAMMEQAVMQEPDSAETRH